MTGRQFVQEHGDPALWSDTEYEQYGLVATPGSQPVPPEVIAYIQQPPTTRIEDRPDGSEVLHITPAA